MRVHCWSPACTSIRHDMRRVLTQTRCVADTCFAGRTAHVNLEAAPDGYNGHVRVFLCPAVLPFAAVCAAVCTAATLRSTTLLSHEVATFPRLDQEQAARVSRLCRPRCNCPLWPPGRHLAPFYISTVAPAGALFHNGTARPAYSPHETCTF